KMQLPKTAKNRNLETVRIRVLPPVLLAPLRRPSPAPLRRPATAATLAVFPEKHNVALCQGSISSHLGKIMLPVSLSYCQSDAKSPSTRS
ncbi:hypothetical protein KDW82_34475, partial [Burkholderia vietnamiensis]|nr:hypothetical protein [Burkholderia vietnamiensis]